MLNVITCPTLCYSYGTDKTVADMFLNRAVAATASNLLSILPWQLPSVRCGDGPPCNLPTNWNSGRNRSVYVAWRTNTGSKLATVEFISVAVRFDHLSAAVR